MHCEEIPHYWMRHGWIYWSSDIPVFRNQSFAEPKFALAKREMKSISQDSQISDSVDHVTSSCHEVHERADVTAGLKTSISRR